MTYHLDFPYKLSQIHNSFYVSQLTKFLADVTFVITLDDIQFDECLNYCRNPFLYER